MTPTTIALIIGVIPYVSWGSTSEADKTYWADNGCNTRMCSYWKRKYNVVPGSSWGSLPVDFHPSWSHGDMNCNAK